MLVYAFCNLARDLRSIIPATFLPSVTTERQVPHVRRQILTQKYMPSQFVRSDEVILLRTRRFLARCLNVQIGDERDDRLMNLEHTFSRGRVAGTQSAGREVRHLRPGPHPASRHRRVWQKTPSHCSISKSQRPRPLLQDPSSCPRPTHHPAIHRLSVLLTAWEQLSRGRPSMPLA